MEPAVDWSPFDDLDPRRPGAVAAVVGGGDVLAWGSFGSAGPGGEALTVESTVYVASVAKQFTAGVVGLLALDGALGLDDPVRRWLPELRPSWDGVRIHHLLAHTGGLADANRLDAAAGFGADRPFSTAERVALIAGHDLEHPPGAVHRYSNHGYVLLAAIVERACGETLGEVARRRIFEPLGMSASGFLDGEAPAAVPGWAGGTERVDVRFRCVGDGGLVTSIADLARWDGWLPTSSLADLMLRDRPRAASGELAHDAWGISIRTHRGLRIESHGGSLDGYLAAHVRFPALGARSWCSPTRTPAGPRGSGGGPGKWSTPASPTTSTPVGRRGPRPTASRSTPDARRPPVGLPAVRTVEVGGIRVSAIGLVCWQFGSNEWGYGDWYAGHEAAAIVQRALDLGVTLIDTAEIYGFGRSERIVGAALGERRDEAFVATKLFPVLPIAPVVRWRAGASARRLGTDVIDLYQVHQPNPLVRDGSTMAGMRRLRSEGRIRHVGVSNYSLARWQAAERKLGGPVLSNQVQYSLVHRAPEAELLPWARTNDRLVIAYSPLGQGVLGGRYGPGNRPNGVRSGNRHFLPESLERSPPLLDELRRLAATHDATPAQVALAWVLAQGNVVAIPGASSVEQLEHNAAAADLDLTPDELGELARLSAAYRPAGLGALARDLLRRCLPGRRRS